MTDVKIWDAPRITVIAKTQYIGAPHINWKSDSDNDADQLAEFSGRLCYVSYLKPDTNVEMDGHKVISGRSDNELYMENIIGSGHHSIIEHASWSFLVEGVSRALAMELIRHRIGFSISMLSQRYVDETEVGFIAPPELGEDGRKWFAEQCLVTLEAYRTALNYFMERLPEDLPRTTKLKRARQAARALLTNATETKFVWTGNARAIRHFIGLRANPHADLEIRRFAVELAQKMKWEAPNIFQDLNLFTDEDGLASVKFTGSN